MVHGLVVHFRGMRDKIASKVLSLYAADLDLFSSTPQHQE